MEVKSIATSKEAPMGMNDTHPTVTLAVEYADGEDTTVELTGNDAVEWRAELNRYLADADVVGIVVTEDGNVLYDSDEEADHAAQQESEIAAENAWLRAAENTDYSGEPEWSL